MKHPADMTLEELMALRSQLEQLASTAQTIMMNAIQHYDAISDRIAMAVNLPPKGAGGWDQTWIDLMVEQGELTE